MRQLLFFVLLLFPFASIANETLFSSKGKSPVFIELFTSQGCSSCPPAEKYINSYINKDELWTKYIPVVFHVDYWDYIGWKDVFAQPQFSMRQRRYANLRHVRTVYTPAFVVNGMAWRRGFFNSTPQARPLNAGELNITLKNNTVVANFKPAQKITGKLKLNIALLGNGMQVDITAGENDGLHALHNFVVLGYAQSKPDTEHWQMSLPKINNKLSSRLALVAWLNHSGDPSPVQAVGGWLTNIK